MPLDEKALRRAEFTDGPKVTLGDGQEWTFPTAVMVFYPARDAEGTVRLNGTETYGLDYLDQLEAMFESDDVAERMTIQLRLAVDLLTRNYDLDDRALRRLLPMSMDGSTREMWQALAAVLTGTSAPKPSPDGSASA